MDASRVGSLQLLEVLGRGGMSEVWRARHDSGLEVAVKLARAARARERRVRDAFFHEARAVARLRHRHIVQLYELGSADGAPYLVMELAAGTLVDRLGALTWSRTRAILEAVLDALAHAHARGVVHRDVKPSNVLLAADGRPILADFGLASAYGRGGGGGTPGYMAPEQLGSEIVGRRADLYGVGCLAWALVGGRHPWQERAPGDALPPLLAEVPAPAGLMEWVQALTRPDPADRPATAADARAGLDALDSSSTGPVESLAGVSVVPTRSFPAMSLPATVERHLGTEPPTRWAEPVALDPLRSLPAPSIPAPRAPARFRESPPVAEVPRGHGLSLLALREPPVIGRGEEQAQLWEAIREVSRGATRVVVLEGPEGSGRSHLGRWALRTADEHGLAVRLETRAGSAPPGVAWLREVAGARAVAWLVDDAHLDPALVRAVRQVLDAPVRPPLLVILTAGPGEPLGIGQRVVLGPLTRRDGLKLVEHVFGLTGTAADPVVERAAGNPGLAVALVRESGARGALSGSAAGLADPQGQAPVVPQSLREVEAGRIAKLPLASREVLEAAAALGGELVAEAASALGPWDPAAIEALEERGLLEPGPSGMRLVRPTLGPVIRELAEAEGRWASVCGRYLAWAEGRSDPDGPALVRIARAQGAVGRAPEAAATLERAGTLLRRQGHLVASSDALLEERRLRTALGQPPGDPWVRNAFQLALNAIYQHRYTEAEEWLHTLEQAIAAHPERAGGDCVHVARGRLHHLRNELPDALRCYAEAERVALEQGPGEVVAYMRMSQANVLSELGRTDEALPLLDRAEEGYRSLGLVRDAEGVAIGRAFALESLRDPAAGPLLDRIVADSPADPNVEITARILRGNNRRRAGDREGAEADYRRALRLVLDLGTNRVPMPLIALASLEVDRDPAAARADFLAIEGSCVGLDGLFWAAASLPAFARDPDFEDRLRVFEDRLERSGRLIDSFRDDLLRAARRAEGSAAARCRQMAGLRKDAEDGGA